LLTCALAGCKHNSDADAIAKVNGHAITRSDLDHYYKEQTAGVPQQLSDEDASTLRLNILETLIDQEIMLQRAEKLGLLATDDEVDSKLNELKSPYSEKEFSDRLKDHGITEAEFKQEWRRKLTVEKVLNKEVTSKINISDAEITAYYNEHQADFNLVEAQYHIALIAVTSVPSTQVTNLKHDKAQNDQDARKKIDMLQKQLDNGEDFAGLAMSYSELPDSASNGGDIGFVSEQSLRQSACFLGTPAPNSTPISCGEYPAVFDAIAKLKPGQYTSPLPMLEANSHHPVGYAIFKLLQKTPKGQKELSDPRVQQLLRQKLRDRKEQLLRTAFMIVARNQAKIENFYAQELLNKFQK